MSILATWVLVWQPLRYCQTGFALTIVLPLCFEDKRWRRIYELAGDGDCKEKMKESKSEGKESGRRRGRETANSLRQYFTNFCLLPVGLNNADCNYRKQCKFVSVVTTLPLLRLKRNEVTSVGIENIFFEKICCWRRVFFLHKNKVWKS